MKIQRIVFLPIFLSIVAAGCATHAPGSHNYKDTPLPRVPPAPPLKPEPLDESLRQAARQELLNNAQSSDPFLRCNTIEALGDVAPDVAEGPILQGLSDGSPAVRYAAALAAGQLQLRSVYDTLLAHVQDPDLRVQAAVRFALHRLGDKRYSHDLERFAIDFNPVVRASTAQVLGMLGEPSGIAILAHMLADHTPAVRLQAAEALWQLGDERGLKDLVAYSISSFPDEQIVAFIALAQRGDQRVIEHCRSGLTSDYPEVCLAAARAMGMLGSDEGWTVAVAAASSKDPRQRLLAAMAMGAIGRCDLQSTLKGLLNDPKPEVRIAAATAILQLRAPPSIN